jgi:hypothetical protein
MAALDGIEERLKVLCSLGEGPGLTDEEAREIFTKRVGRRPDGMTRAEIVQRLCEGVTARAMGEQARAVSARALEHRRAVNAEARAKRERSPSAGGRDEKRVRGALDAVAKEAEAAQSARERRSSRRRPADAALADALGEHGLDINLAGMVDEYLPCKQPTRTFAPRGRTDPVWSELDDPAYPYQYATIVDVRGVDGVSGLQMAALADLIRSECVVTVIANYHVHNLEDYAGVVQAVSGRAHLDKLLFRESPTHDRRTPFGPRAPFDLCGMFARGLTVDKMVFHFAHVENDELSSLADCARLRSLDLSHCTGFTETGLLPLLQTKGLQELNLRRTNTVLAVYQPSPQSQLRTLNQSSSSARDSSLKYLPLGLHSLDLSWNNGVTDRGLELMAQHGQLAVLEKLNLVRTKVTDEGKTRLRAAFPGLEIVELE